MFSVLSQIFFQVHGMSFPAGFGSLGSPLGGKDNKFAPQKKVTIDKFMENNSELTEMGKIVLASALQLSSIVDEPLLEYDAFKNMVQDFLNTLIE